LKDIKVAKVFYSDVSDLYPEIYSEIFEHVDIKQLPSYVYLVWYKAKYVGFMSAYLHNTDEVYLQYAGFNDEHKGFMAVGLFKEIIENVHKDYKGIICRIENTNISALKVAMNAGFIIMGIRCLSQSSQIFVELIKIKEDNNNG